MSQYDIEKCLYWTNKGYGPFPVLTQTWTDQLQHLAVPQLFMAGVRVAVCDNHIELEWGVVLRIEGSLPICNGCIARVENLP